MKKLKLFLVGEFGSWVGWGGLGVKPETSETRSPQGLYKNNFKKSKTKNHQIS
jgi:hypothetical protein